MTVRHRHYDDHDDALSNPCANEAHDRLDASSQNIRGLNRLCSLFVIFVVTIYFATKTNEGYIPLKRLQRKVIGTDDSEAFSTARVPSEFEGCCGPGKNKWEQTCYTGQACGDPLYPFRNKEEAAFFQPYWPATQSEQKRRDRNCRNAWDKLAPIHHWCKNKKLRDYIPLGCSPYKTESSFYLGPFHHLLLFPEGKLAFCGIPKAGITQWRQFRRFVFGAMDYQGSPHLKTDLMMFLFDHLQPSNKNEIMQTWTLAALIREPSERLLSAYLEKVQGNKEIFGRIVSFSEFVDILFAQPEAEGTYGLSWFTDPHWRPQAWSCGLSEDLPNFGYLGTLEKAAQHTRGILESVGMWDSHGKNYRISNETTAYPEEAVPPPDPDIPAQGFQQRVGMTGQDGMDTIRHSLGSHKLLKLHYTPELLQKVKEIYWMDFALYDAIKRAEDSGKVRGRDVAALLDPELCSYNE